MPEEILAIIVITILSGTLIILVKAVLGYLSSKRQGVEHPGSLTMSELKTLIQEAVVEANVPLVERIDALEERSHRLEAPVPLIDLDEPADALSNEPATMRRRVH